MSYVGRAWSTIKLCHVNLFINVSVSRLTCLDMINKYVDPKTPGQQELFPMLIYGLCCERKVVGGYNLVCRC